MKRYKLLKDLPCAEAGKIFQQGFDENDKDNIYLFQEILGAKQIKIWLDYIDDFDEWFEEVKETEQYFSINIFKATVEEIKNIHYSKVLDRLKDWKETLNNEYIKHYIFSPENKEGEVIRYVSLMPENILVSIYNNKCEIIL